MENKPVMIPEGLTEEIVTQVENQIKEMLSDNLEIVNLVTSINPRKGNLQAKYITVIEAKDKNTGLSGQTVFSTLKLYREIKKTNRSKK